MRVLSFLLRLIAVALGFCSLWAYTGVATSPEFTVGWVAAGTVLFIATVRFTALADEIDDINDQ